ncbi:MAG: hypothetical protein U0527_00535 [Candidatus Eisenbacteria bacterium]
MSMLREFIRRLSRPGPSGTPIAPRERWVDGHRVVEDLGHQIFTLTLRTTTSHGSSLLGGHGGEPLPAPTLTAVAPDQFVGGATLAEKARRFDQRLLASIERVAQAGAGGFAGRNVLLRGLARAIAGTVKPDDASLALMTAARLGGAGLPEPFATVAQSRAQAALKDGSIPPATGVFTNSRELETAHRQCTLLEAPPKGRDGIARLKEILATDQEARATYERLELLRARVENPSSAPVLITTPREAVDPVPLFSPRLRLAESVTRRLLDASAPEDPHTRFEALLRRLRATAITPKAESGWHDWLAWSLEPLAKPESMKESARLRLADSYRASLLEIVRSALDTPSAVRLGAPALDPSTPIDPPRVTVRPNFRVEPLPTFYLRRGLGYRFLHQSLVEVLGTETLATLVRELQGGGSKGLRDELDEMEALFLGAFAVACEDIGMKIDSAVEADPAPFLRWMESSDPDLARDSRELIPLQYDAARGQIRSLLVLGWRERLLEIGYLAPPPASIFDEQERLVPEKRVRFEPQLVRVPTPVTLEVHVSAPIARGELRELGDRAGSVQELVHRLG